ncbi:MAG: radical SAM protein [Candidatus Hadarchaeales archaeon]
MSLLHFPTVRKALFGEKLDGRMVRCSLCERRCIIGPGSRGYCRTRINIEGELYTLVYGDISAIESRPIEIKPFFHYWPGSRALTFSTWSCNFNCQWCQNHHLSRTEPEPSKGNFISPEKVVELAIKEGDQGLCASFQEPTLLTEWALEVFRLGKKRGLYCCYVSNGYMTREALRKLADAGLDGLKIDIKGDDETYKKFCGGADVEKIWRNAREAKLLGLYVEIVNLVVTGVNDSEKCLRWVIQKHLQVLGPETPLHFTRYYPAHMFFNPPTPVETLERAYLLAREMGVLYTYLGNVSGHPYENTSCPRCGREVIRRFGCRFVSSALTKDKRCPSCGEPIPITGPIVK